MAKLNSIIFVLVVGIVLMANGEEEDSSSECFCFRILAPVCGTNNVTYSNDCTACCATAETPGLGIAYFDACDGRSADDGIQCTDEFKPHCGSDRITYSNMCHVRAAMAKDACLKSKSGICPDPANNKLFN